MTSLDPCLGNRSQTFDRLQTSHRIRIGDSSCDFVLRNITLDPTAIEVYGYRHEGCVGRFQRGKSVIVRPAERGR